jgi:hypothetical protein
MAGKKQFHKGISGYTSGRRSWYQQCSNQMINNEDSHISPPHFNFS